LLPSYCCEIQGAANRTHSYLRGGGGVFVGVILMYSSHANVNMNWMLAGKKEFLFREL
jgi:hypothetical protein